MIFFCLFRRNFNAATLAEKAIEEGALAVIVEQPEFENKEKNIFYVPSTLEFCSNWPFITEATYYSFYWPYRK
jgi:UDP-N-acetylmuramyl pentapeptide synthase